MADPITLVVGAVVLLTGASGIWAASSSHTTRLQQDLRIQTIRGDLQHLVHGVGPLQNQIFVMALGPRQIGKSSLTNLLFGYLTDQAVAPPGEPVHSPHDDLPVTLDIGSREYYRWHFISTLGHSRGSPHFWFPVSDYFFRRQFAIRLIQDHLVPGTGHLHVKTNQFVRRITATASPADADLRAERDAMIQRWDALPLFPTEPLAGAIYFYRVWVESLLVFSLTVAPHVPEFILYLEHLSETFPAELDRLALWFTHLELPRSLRRSPKVPSWATPSNTAMPFSTLLGHMNREDLLLRGNLAFSRIANIPCYFGSLNKQNLRDLSILEPVWGLCTRMHQTFLGNPT